MSRAPRDVTPEAFEAVYDKAIPGFGEMFRWVSLRHLFHERGRTLLTVLGVALGVAVFVAMLALCVWAESQGNASLSGLGVSQAGGNLEGKEVRFGMAPSAIWATATTAFLWPRWRMIRR